MLLCSCLRSSLLQRHRLPLRRRGRSGRHLLLLLLLMVRVVQQGPVLQGSQVVREMLLQLVRFVQQGRDVRRAVRGSHHHLLLLLGRLVQRGRGVSSGLQLLVVQHVQVVRVVQQGLAVRIRRCCRHGHRWLVVQVVLVRLVVKQQERVVRPVVLQVARGVLLQLGGRSVVQHGVVVVVVVVRHCPHGLLLRTPILHGLRGRGRQGGAGVGAQ